MTRTLALLAVAGALLAGCADPPPQSGYVISKSYDDPDDWIYMMPIYGERCTPVTSYNPSSKTTTTSLACASYVTSYVPIPEHDGPHWFLKLRDDKDAKHVGGLEVSESAFNRYTSGDHYPDAR